MALVRELYDLPLTEVQGSRQFRELLEVSRSPSEILSLISATAEPSTRPFHLLYLLLAETSGPWPTFELIKCHARLFKVLPESTKILGAYDEPSRLVDSVNKLVKQHCGPFAQFIPCDDRPALRSTDATKIITYKTLHRLVSNFHLPLPSSDNRRKPIVAIAVPNGPLLAATCVAVVSRYIAAPINQATGSEQFQADVIQAGAEFIITTTSDYQKLGLSDRWVRDRNIQVFIVDWMGGDHISFKTLAGDPVPRTARTAEPNQGDDVGMILFTSGTSGTKKVVPLTTHSIIAGIVHVMESWGLSSSDVCINMMPLYHVGGLVRNIFAPLFSGGSTVCCSAFDPNLFWDVVQDIQATWYYASPSMHSVILAEAASRPEALKGSRIRLACNAAGGLLPSLACQLRDTFNCVVLPSYGMTECMPISTPPLDYKLDREGTSGISTGPEVSILDGNEFTAPTGTVGRICVRGEPVFPGYLRPDGTFDKSAFNTNGWFDTGDLGYMDDDGYLYITGRSKEVINRGGELISPFEVENAIMSASMSTESVISGRVVQALAFSASHDVLQEVVAIALVCSPGMPRVDLKAIHAALRSSLQQAKWPAFIVYMNDLPKKNNKVLRIKLGQRLGVPELTDNTPYLDRHWEAACPPPDSALSVSISSSPCPIDNELLLSKASKIVPSDIEFYCRLDFQKGVEAFLAPSKAGSQSLERSYLNEFRQLLGMSVHNYMVPAQVHLISSPIPRNMAGDVDEAQLQKKLEELLGESMDMLESSTEGLVTRAFADTLSLSPGEIPRDVDFFSLGGDSLRAGRLVSALRAQFHVNVPISLVFDNATVANVACHIEKMAKSAPVVEKAAETPICSKTYSSTNLFLMLVQLIPLAVIYPLRRAVQWTLFLVAFAYGQRLPTNDSVPGRLFNLTVSILLARVAIRCTAPFVGIVCKWLIIGRYREGLHPMWGFYHTRWWLVEKITSICGKGIFNTNDTTRRIYCRLMGAKIGKNVKLTGASLGEWDLLDIRDGATLGRCTCRPFAAEGNTAMYLGRIVVGENCSVGMSSIVAPGTILPPNTCIGPNSSSWEMEDADEAYRDLAPSLAAKPHWILKFFMTMPLSLLVWFLTLLPWMGGLLGMVMTKPTADVTPLRGILAWFTEAERVGYHYLALVLRCFFSPFILFGFTVLIRMALDTLFGKLGPGSASQQGSFSIWRANLIKTLCPVSQLHEVTGLFGQHYEATSVALRLMGAKVGRRVYWPGTGPSIGDYHLLEVGNDVVFGSRSHLVTSDGTSSDRIIIKDRAMIADRVCLLPGVTIGERVTMGSGALTKRDKNYPAGGTYVGAQAGDAVCLLAGREAQEKKLPKYDRTQSVGSIDTLAWQDNSRRASSVPTLIPFPRKMSSLDTLADGTPSSGTPKHRSPSSSQNSVDNDSDGEPDPDSYSPFGRAFYLNRASYRVWGPFAIFCYSSFLTVFTAFFWNVPSISSIQLVDLVVKQYLPRGISVWYDVLAVFCLSFIAIAILTTAQAVLSLAIVIGAKWVLLGRRQPGNYDWDKSPYCQRWQLFLSIEKLRRQCYKSYGVLGLLTGTHWLVLYFRALGATIGRDCALFANGKPSLMFTEPDLITLGDRVVVDDASVVAHINTRGKFDLNRLDIGDRCVLRTGSRLLSGAQMKNDSCLLEHTLIMGGDVVEEKCTMQGWPANRYFKKRLLL